MLLILSLLACPPTKVEVPTCGVGTHEVNGICIGDEADADTDSDTDADSDADSDTDTDTDTDLDGDTYVDGDDCDDTDATIHPGATELCDGIDQDCDQVADDDAQLVTWYRDADGDGFGDPAGTLDACPAPEGYVDNNGDCDDASASINPDAQEVCSGVDDDCDGLVDADDPTMEGFATWYRDADGDGFGVESSTVEACDQPDGYARDVGDCDDAAVGTNPDASEHCDGVDEDCDGALDNDPVDATTWYVDADADGYGDTSVTKTACDQPAGYVADDADCDDADATASPGLVEACGDGVDNDCDGGSNGCGISGTASLSGADAKLTGSAASMLAGSSVSFGGDLTGDGWEDLLVSEVWYDGVSGAAYIHAGPTSGTTSLSLDIRLAGENPNDYAGGALAGAGDVNGDGADDLLVGAMYGASESGRVYLMYGPIPASTSLSTADIQIDGVTAPDHLGSAIVALGDVDADGFADFALGAGPESSVGTYSGAAYLFLGGSVTTGTSASAEAILEGEASYDYAGQHMGAAGDIDGDGIPDLIVSADTADGGARDSGIVYVVYMPTSGTMSLTAADVTLKGVAEADQAGHSVSGDQDVDGDGAPDLLIGVPDSNDGGQDAGGAYLVTGVASGASSLSTATAFFVGEDPDDQAGVTVSLPGDLDGDGVGDVAVGGRGDDSGGSGSGAVYVLYGGSLVGTIDLSMADAKLYGEAAGDDAGMALAGSGDANDDGNFDLFLGAEYESSAGYQAGAAYILYGGGL